MVERREEREGGEKGGWRRRMKGIEGKSARGRGGRCRRKRRREGWREEKRNGVERGSNPICFNTMSPTLFSLSSLFLSPIFPYPPFSLFFFPLISPLSPLFSPLLSSTLYCPLASLLYCSLHPASDTSTQGVLYYVDNNTTLNWLISSGPYPPYIAMVEPEMFNWLVCLI